MRSCQTWLASSSGVNPLRWLASLRKSVAVENQSQLSKYEPESGVKTLLRFFPVKFPLGGLVKTEGAKPVKGRMFRTRLRLLVFNAALAQELVVRGSDTLGTKMIPKMVEAFRAAGNQSIEFDIVPDG
jgi:hypothetical protein